VGSRMIDSVSKMMIKAGFSSLDKALEEKLKESSGK
jgi:hypothetical protein